MRRILFVDDETKVLQGLRRMLYPLRGEWEMEFADSGDAALALFESQQFDVVVTDMRMPGMDGAELLSHIREREPKVARIVLSGHAEQSAAVRAAGIAHQFLAKPCDAEELKRTVSRTCKLRERLSNSELLEKITGMGKLPSLPAIYDELQAEITCEEPSICRVGEIVSQDIGMSAKILQLVNSAFFGLRRQIESVTEATNLLGMDVIHDLVLSSSVFEVLDDRDSAVSMETIWRHGIASSCVARQTAGLLELDKVAASESGQAAMLLDAGRIALATRLFEAYRDVVTATEAGKDVVDAEREVFGCGHPEVGGYLLGLWGLPDSIVEAVTFHHEPQLSQDSGIGVVAVVYASDALVAAYDSADTADTADTVAAKLSAVGLEDRCDELRQLTVSTMGFEEKAA